MKMYLKKIFLGAFLFSILFSAHAEFYWGRALSCDEMTREETNQTMAEWFLSESESLRKQNPSYTAGTVFETPVVVTKSIHCGNKAKEHIEAIRHAVDDNRRNVGNPDYTPRSIPEMMLEAKKELGLAAGYVFDSTLNGKAVKRKGASTTLKP